jgi:hypothetical protein
MNMEENDKRFRERILELGNIAADKMEEYFHGKRSGTDMVKESSKMIDQAVKVSNRNEQSDSVKISQAIRIMAVIPVDRRNEYICATMPETKPFLLTRPKGVKGA